MPTTALAPAATRLALLLALAGPAAAQADGAPAPGDAAQALTTLIGDAACRSDDDCRTVAVGRLACGGPAAWLPWSAWRSAPKAVARAAQRAGTAAAAPPGRGGDLSICVVLPDPGAFCAPPPPHPAPAGASGQCRLRPLAAGVPVPPTR